MWRPKGAKQWYKQTKPLLTNQGIIPPQTEYPIIISSEFEWEVLKRRCFEAGADAMLEALWKMAKESPTGIFYFDSNIKQVYAKIYDIPDEEEQSQKELEVRYGNQPTV